MGPPPPWAVGVSAALVFGSIFMTLWGTLLLNGVVAAAPLDSCNVSAINATCLVKAYHLRGSTGPSFRFIPLLRGVSTMSDGSNCPIIHESQFDSSEECGDAMVELLEDFGHASVVPCYGPDATWIDDEVACTRSPKPSSRAPRFMHGHFLTWGGVMALGCSLGIAGCVKVSYD
jgi:hypothetical protein